MDVLENLILFVNERGWIRIRKIKAVKKLYGSQWVDVPTKTFPIYRHRVDFTPPDYGQLLYLRGRDTRILIRTFGKELEPTRSTTGPIRTTEPIPSTTVPSTTELFPLTTGSARTTKLVHHHHHHQHHHHHHCIASLKVSPSVRVRKTDFLLYIFFSFGKFQNIFPSFSEYTLNLKIRMTTTTVATSKDNVDDKNLQSKIIYLLPVTMIAAIILVVVLGMLLKNAVARSPAGSRGSSFHGS